MVLLSFVLHRVSPTVSSFIHYRVTVQLTYYGIKKRIKYVVLYEIYEMITLKT